MRVVLLTNGRDVLKKGTGTSGVVFAKLYDSADAPDVKLL